MSKATTKAASNAAQKPAPGSVAKRPFYITTTLPYVNAEPHVGHALEFIRADVIARYKKLMGFDVFFNTGTDEHGVKVYQKAVQAHVDPQKYVDDAAAKFKELLPILGISSDIKFTRTTDPHHIMAAQAFWKMADKNGLIYKKNYAIKYCNGCELEKTESELVDGKCPLHALQEIEIIEEENYFFRFSLYQKPLMDLYERGSASTSNAENQNSFVIPNSRLNEIRAFVERGIEDFSVTRLSSKMPWGIPVPGDTTHVMYVWFDALVNYISTIGWPDDEQSFGKWWKETGGAVQYCGKDNLRQQSAMWQAMLMAVGLTPSKVIVVNGFVTGAGGVKMSKSLGNTVSPIDVINEFGTDAFRYFVTKELHPFEDSPFTIEKFKETYNAGLANGLGNLTSRIMKMAQDNIQYPISNVQENENGAVMDKFASIQNPEFFGAIDSFNLQKAMNVIWEKIAVLDQRIQKEQPFALVKTDKEKGTTLISELVAALGEVAVMLQPFLPETAHKISTCIRENKMPAAPLFVRK
ncbi:MAG: methionine--tRNA ligase [Candidatus Taylorbacteria bacterium]